jgi:hypothetical protein
VAASTSVIEDAAFRLIGNDLLFARRYLHAAIERSDERQAHIPMFCMTNYLSLYIHESYRAMQRLDPQAAAALAVGNAQIIERSRHTVKFFDDTNPQHGGVNGVAAQFSDIIREHRAFFLGNTWLPPARVLETDIAVYRYLGRLVSTTHAISFYTGLPPESIRNHAAMGQALGSLAESQAHYIASLTNTLPWQGLSFMDALSLGKLTNHDRRAARFYGKPFDAGLPEEVTAALTAFQAALNFLDLMVATDPNIASAEAVFKVKFITLYHLLSSLATFHAERGASLGPASASRLDSILTHPTTTEIIRPDRKGFRNILIHYMPFPQVASQLSLDLPLCGLVEAYYPGTTYADMSTAVAEHTTRVATHLDAWAKGR